MKKGLGFFLGFIFGILGLLGLLACNTPEEKSSFMKGWILSFVIGIVLIVILFGAGVCSIGCLAQNYA